ncbi:MAG TPA: hypothetical protein DCL54_09635 [Alphaproteobacteria bacterium]|nr:hypothetical protein [Alphaproteobacteria bacterium]
MTHPLSLRRAKLARLAAGLNAKGSRGRLKRVQEKWRPVFRQDTRKNKELERDDGWEKTHPALALVLFTDDERAVDWAEAVSALPRGSAVIVRSRDAKTQEQKVRQLLPVARKRHVLLLVSQDWRLAWRLRADGVHVPEAQMSTNSGLRRRNPRWLITAATHGPYSKGAVTRLKPHHIFLSPLWPTASHLGANTLGPARWGLQHRAYTVPAYALGGIDESNAQHALSIGAAGLGLISAWTDE